VVPPALIADIAGGTYPALLNILLALRMRDKTGVGTHLDIAMSEGVLPFLYWALGAGQVGGPWPGNGDSLVTGGTARYRLYPTRDGRIVAAAPIEQKFWEAFAAAIGLDATLVLDETDPAATIAAVSRIIAGETAEHWRPILSKADCCATLVASAEAAMSDPHFMARGVFAARVRNARGQSIAALPVPIAAAYRAPADRPVASPALGADTSEVLR
jgi:crotonobetainyl-CoA:carnitine CoA-transferase CaiB-like acyl-CoA transferase